MYSSDDDEPLAVLASKAKREGRVNDKERRQKAGRKKRIKSGSSTESQTNDGGSGKRVRRKKKKPALENEFESDEISLADKDDEGETKTTENTPVRGRDPQSSQRQSISEEKNRVDDAAQRSTSKSDDSSATSTHIEQNDEQSRKNPGEEHVKVNDESDSSLSNSCEKSKEDERSLRNSDEEQANVDNKLENSLSDDSDKNKAPEKHLKKKEKRKRKTKQKSENESSGKTEMRKQKEQSEDGATIRLTKLKKMVTLAGLRIVYKKFFEDIADNDRLRVKALEKEMERRGLTPPFTMEACRAFKLQKQQEAELAELSKNYIIDIGENQKGRVTRGQRSAALATRRRGGIIFEESSDEDEDELEEREHMKQETQNMFKNLRGIVSDDADSD